MADDPVGDDSRSKGHELARKALEDAREAARAAGKSVGQGRASPVRRHRPGSSAWSGARADRRDPQSLGAAAGAIARNRGWQARLGEGRIFGSWEQIVGADIAAHARPTQLHDKVLSVSAESTAWATQLRLVQADLLARIAADVGHGVVVSLRITGPKPPSWRKGERHVRGRGPRDTYG